MDTLFHRLFGPASIELNFWVAGMVGFRTFPIVMLTPFLTFGYAPTFFRTVVAVIFVVILTPYALASAPTLSMSAIAFLSSALRELLLGVAFAIATSVPFFALRWAGQLADTWRGAHLMESTTPMSAISKSELGDLYVMTGIVLFFSLGGHRLALTTMVDTFSAVPIGGHLDSHTVSFIVLECARIVANIITFSALFAVPMAAAIVVSEIAFGLIGRSFPNIPLYFIGMPLRAVWGLIIGLFILLLFPTWLPEMFREAIEIARRLFTMIGVR